MAEKTVREKEIYRLGAQLNALNIQLKNAPSGSPEWRELHRSIMLTRKTQRRMFSQLDKKTGLGDRKQRKEYYVTSTFNRLVKQYTYVLDYISPLKRGDEGYCPSSAIVAHVNRDPECLFPVVMDHAICTSQCFHTEITRLLLRAFTYTTIYDDITAQECVEEVLRRYISYVREDSTKHTIEHENPKIRLVR